MHRCTLPGHGVVAHSVSNDFFASCTHVTIMTCYTYFPKSSTTYRKKHMHNKHVHLHPPSIDTTVCKVIHNLLSTNPNIARSTLVWITCHLLDHSYKIYKYGTRAAFHIISYSSWLQTPVSLSHLSEQLFICTRTRH